MKKNHDSNLVDFYVIFFYKRKLPELFSISGLIHGLCSLILNLFFVLWDVPTRAANLYAYLFGQIAPTLRIWLALIKAFISRIGPNTIPCLM